MSIVLTIEYSLLLLFAVFVVFKISKAAKTKALTNDKALYVGIITVGTLIIGGARVITEYDEYVNSVFILTASILLLESITDIISYDIYTIPIYAATLIIAGLAAVYNGADAELVKRLIVFPIFICLSLELTSLIKSDEVGDGDVLLIEFLAFNPVGGKCRIYAFSLTVTFAIVTVYGYIKKRRTSAETNNETKEIQKPAQGQTGKPYPLAPIILLGYLITAFI